MQHEQHRPGAAGMRPNWIPELPVPPDLAAEVIGRQFPQLRGASVTELAAGWDNIVYLVAGVWVFRFPRRQVAVPGLAREAAVLPRAAAP